MIFEVLSNPNCSMTLGVLRQPKTLLRKFPFLEIFFSYFAALALLTRRISAGFSR